MPDRFKIELDEHLNGDGIAYIIARSDGGEIAAQVEDGDLASAIQFLANAVAALVEGEINELAEKFAPSGFQTFKRDPQGWACLSNAFDGIESLSNPTFTEALRAATNQQEVEYKLPIEAPDLDFLTIRKEQNDA